MSSREFVVRPLSPEDDLEGLTDLLHRSYRELLVQGLNFTATNQTVETTARRVSEGECWVAESIHSLIGTIVWVRPNPTDNVAYYRLPHVAHFGQFGVDPEFRRCGVGRALLRQVELRAGECGYEELALDTSEYATHLVDLYAKLGFIIVDRHDWRPHVNYPSLIMSKRLGV